MGTDTKYGRCRDPGLCAKSVRRRCAAIGQKRCGDGVIVAIENRRAINVRFWISVATGALSESSKSTKIASSKNVAKAASYKFCTKYEESRGLEKSGRRKKIGSLPARRSPEVSVRRGVFMGSFARLKVDEHIWKREHWRREWNWNPTFSVRRGNR
jgi:hypothetical protein